ncbi:thioredoxin domain-containing protein [Candidatus Jorgensenbacteria bacterium]|nr:thioredoxin domain-containing protein [Candidatus Jorgensenbacteria bacterium]
MDSSLPDIPQQAENKPKRDYILPASILVAALLISFSLVYSAGKKATVSELGGRGGGGGEDTLAADVGEAFNDIRPTPSPVNIKAVTENDHIRGSLSAAVKVVEFSDLECPFCKRFHSTMQQAVETYGDKIAWVYRHFPLDSLHSKARKEAEAAECANELGGNNGFWKYVDELLRVTPSNNGLEATELPNIAERVGLNRTKFETCLSSGKYASRVEADLTDAENSGGRGTPYSVVISKSGKKYIINGALPWEDVRVIIEEALK